MMSQGSLWDSDLVGGVAFHASKCRPNTNLQADGSGWIDSEVKSRDGTTIAYRLYTSTSARKVTKSNDGEGVTPSCVLIYFHANAELCTDLERDVGAFYSCGFTAVLCPEFRGYGWSGGKPRLSALYQDAQAVMERLPDILGSISLKREDVSIVVQGRSLGTVCAVHLAATCGHQVDALVVESGVMSLTDLPMVRQLGSMMPDLFRMLQAQPCPARTLEEIKTVAVPTIIIHGIHDEIVPVKQAVLGHAACGSTAKKLVRLPRCKHNDVRSVAGAVYYQEIQLICEVATGTAEPEALLMENVSPPRRGLFAALGEAIRCLPGVTRCLGETSPS
eukprot:TRINITY_DN63800_c0_g1_i1.p1 TRINITY_DN63800_c0_g1~~TRINITY_DN63800_c0_g1_i1.p1  ORF type:complete len:333 (+),score=53.28 TRINITY_DN63800_c0_g1_i1:64-1062(+)